MVYDRLQMSYDILINDTRILSNVINEDYYGWNITKPQGSDEASNCYWRNKSVFDFMTSK